MGCRERGSEMFVLPYAAATKLVMLTVSDLIVID